MDCLDTDSFEAGDIIAWNCEQAQWKTVLGMLEVVPQVWKGYAEAGLLHFCYNVRVHALCFLRPLFAQKMRTDGHISKDLRRALEWWIAILQQGKQE